MTFLLGLDFGTGGVRAGLYDLRSHKLSHVAEASYGTQYPQLGWAEQRPEDWWAALGDACRRLMAQAGHPQVAAVCVATTASTVVAARANGEPLRPALLWMDCRAGVESAQTAQVRHPMMNPGGDAVEWLVPKAMWMANNEPGIYASAQRICEAVDWINFRLTGRWVASRLNASCKWNYDTQRERFPVELYEQLGVATLADKLPTQVIPVGGRIGPLCAEAASHLGLSRDTLVAQGGIDAHVAMLSAGTTGAGELLFIGGTSVVQLMHTPQRLDVPGIWGPYPNALLDGQWLMEGGQVSAGSILNWLAQKMFGLDAAGHQQLIRQAQQLKPGATGLLVLDYWMGNRTPYRAPDMRGAIMGLSLNHDRHDLYRASVEAIALGSANVFHTWRSHGIEITRVVAAGGFQNNPLWLQATVDATGVPFEMVAHDNLTLIGTAAAAACALGTFDSLQQAASDFTTQGTLIEPDPAAHDCYVELLGRYREATQSVAPISCKPAPARGGSVRPAA
jgi:ribulose kinase